MSQQSNATTELNERELFVDIGYSEIEVTEFKIKNPKSSSLMQFYLHLVIDLLADVSDVMRLQESQRGVENSDVYTKIKPLMNLTAALGRFSSPVLKAFRVYDLVNPTPKCAFKSLASAVNMIKFAVDRCSDLKLKLQTINDLKEKRGSVITNVNLIRETLTTLAMGMADYKNNYNDNHERICLLQDKLQLYNEKNDEVTEQMNAINSQLTESEENCNEIDSDFYMVEFDETEYARQIEDLKNTVTDLYEIIQENEKTAGLGSQ